MLIFNDMTLAEACENVLRVTKFEHIKENIWIARRVCCCINTHECAKMFMLFLTDFKGNGFGDVYFTDCDIRCCDDLKCYYYCHRVTKGMLQHVDKYPSVFNTHVSHVYYTVGNFYKKYCSINFQFDSKIKSNQISGSH